MTLLTLEQAAALIRGRLPGHIGRDGVQQIIPEHILPPQEIKGWLLGIVSALQENQPPEQLVIASSLVFYTMGVAAGREASKPSKS